MKLKLGSLFDGIGVFPLCAVENYITPVWASEIEQIPINISSRHFPYMKHLGDISKINGAEIEPVDIITFGSPCQDLSVAGKRGGLYKKFKPNKDVRLLCRLKRKVKLKRYFGLTRSGLFMEAIRIIREMRWATNGIYPRFAVWENVPGAFSSNKGQDFRTVLEEIIQAKVPMPRSGRWATAGMVRGNGCDIAWRVLDAQYWGVPQRRRRIFLVADFAGQCAGEILFESQGVSGDTAEGGSEGEEAAGVTGNGVEATGRGDTYVLQMREGCAGGGARGL